VDWPADCAPPARAKLPRACLSLSPFFCIPVPK
jgi:hypothetical protein